MAGPACPADPNPCEAGCSPVNCVDTDTGYWGCQLSGGGEFSCPKIGQTVARRHCVCQNSTGQFCFPQVGDDPVVGTDALYCRP